MSTNDNTIIHSGTILIVDDETDSLRLMTDILSREGYRVRPAERPKFAIESAIADPPGLILLDVRMPEMSGFELSRQLKQDERTKDIPIIFVSGLQDIEDRMQGFEAGGVDFITKPFQEREILARVRTHMNLHNLQLNMEKIVTDRTAQLMESESRFRATFEQAAVGIAHVSLEGKFLRVNRKLCDIVGYLENEIFDLTFQDITHPEDLNTDLTYVQQVLDGEIENYSIEKRYYRKDGTVIWINLTVSLLFDKEGKPKYFVSVVKDISKRKEAEEKLEQSNERFRLAFENGNIAICLVDLDGRLMLVNDQMSTMYGYSREELQSMTVNTLSHPEDLKLSPQFMKQASSREIDHKRFIKRYVHKDGSIIWGDVSSVIVRDDQGNPLYFISYALDITERRKADENLAKSEARYRNLVDNSLVGVFTTTLDGGLIFVNDAMARMYDFDSPEQMMAEGSLARWSDLEQRKKLLALLEAHGSVSNFEAQTITNTGRHIHVLFSVKLQGDLLTGMVMDITEHKKAELELQKSLVEIKRLKELYEKESAYLQKEIRLEHNFENIIGNSNAIKYTLFKVEQVAETDSTVLILGETGTGKELVARAIHHNSKRKDRPLIKINCATLPANLIESELFGHERGSFTSASNRHTGRFEVADGSSIFLDEIGEMPIELQAKLLRVIEDGEFERLGSTKTLKVDARIIAATNRDLEKDAREGRFRQDLWYRLNVFPITLPPLRDRVEDIPLIVQYYLDIFAKKLGKDIVTVPAKVMKTLESYAWPGNIRELQNLLERAVIGTSGSSLVLSEELRQNDQTSPESFKSLQDMERDYIVKVLEKTNWKVSGKNSAAEILKLERSTLRAKLNKMNIHKP